MPRICSTGAACGLPLLLQRPALIALNSLHSHALLHGHWPSNCVSYSAHRVVETVTVCTPRGSRALQLAQDTLEIMLFPVNRPCKHLSPYSTKCLVCVDSGIYNDDQTNTMVTQVGRNSMWNISLFLSFALVLGCFPSPNATIWRYLYQHVGIYNHKSYFCVSFAVGNANEFYYIPFLFYLHSRWLFALVIKIMLTTH